MKRADEPNAAGKRRISIDVSEDVFQELERRPAGASQVVRAWVTQRARAEKAKRTAAPPRVADNCGPAKRCASPFCRACNLRGTTSGRVAS